MQSDIDVSGFDFEETLAKERRRRAEHRLSEGLTEVEALLLPLFISLARLTARMHVRELVQ